jgi:zinc resistance-associated protein
VEENMLKPVIAAAAVLAIAGSSIVYAQQRFGGPGGYGDGSSRFEWHQPSADDIKAFSDARIAALKAGLALTPDQEKNWPPFEQALRDLAKLRLQRIEARAAAAEQQPPSDPFERLQHRAEAMSQRGAALKRVADAGAPLYQSLNDAQKHRFTILARILRPHHHMHDGMGGGWRQGHYGRDGGRDGHWFGREGRRFGEDGRGPGDRLHELMDSEDQGSQL